MTKVKSSRMAALPRTSNTPMKILLAADGSDYTRKAAKQLAKYVAFLKEPAEIHVLYVHPKLPYPGAASVVGKGAIEKYQKEDSDKALKVAEAELRKAELRFQPHWVVGDVCEEIGAFVKGHKIDLVVMGSHGHGALANLAMGSVATKVIAALKVPVLIVR